MFVWSRYHSRGWLCNDSCGCISCYIRVSLELVMYFCSIFKDYHILLLAVYETRLFTAESTKPRGISRVRFLGTSGEETSVTLDAANVETRHAVREVWPDAR